jgi:glycosyltransferase involved in cell wall biosynthesis
MKAPLVSIVIANFNYGQFLEEAIRSVLEQSWGDFELIVVDGGSTDNSVQIIKKYADKLAWWCSEKDRGQSHAFNKGFAKATGKYLTWLNADDLLLPNTLKKVSSILRAHPECRWLTGNFLRYLQDGTIMECKWGPHYLPNFLQRPNAPIVVYGPTSFFEKKLYDEAGGVDETLHYIMDTDLWLRFMHMNVKQRRLNHCCWAFRMHETSKTAFFTGMKVEKNISTVLCSEKVKVYARYNYRCSKVLRILHIILRLIDGSGIVYLFKKNVLAGKHIDLQRIGKIS